MVLNKDVGPTFLFCVVWFKHFCKCPRPALHMLKQTFGGLKKYVFRCFARFKNQNSNSFCIRFGFLFDLSIAYMSPP